jgi:orotate phosphoribosyltransferase
MKDYQHEFLDFAIGLQALRFGEFTLKSGRQSPYFFNTGLFNTGRSLARLGQFYAEAITSAGIEFDMLYGPAYKGVPLVTATAMAFTDRQRDVPYAFNRKEVKKYAEGGIIIGSPLHGRVLIVDDVISAGLSVKDSVDIIRAGGAVPAGVAIALDRQERGQGEHTAVEEVGALYGLAVVSIVTLDHVIEHLGGRPNAAEHLDAIRAYRAAYGGRANG